MKDFVRQLASIAPAVAAASLIAACGGSTTPTNGTSPTPATADAVLTAAQTYFTDLTTDCASAWAMFDDNARLAVGAESDYCSTPHNDDQSVNFGSVTHQDDQHASVAVTVLKKTGATHHDELDLVLNGSTWKVDTLRPDSQQYDTAVLDFDQIPIDIANQYQNNTGHAVNLNCADSGQQTLTLGDTVLCSFTTDAGATGQIKITAEPFNNWIWHTVDSTITTPSPSAVPTCAPGPTAPDGSCPSV